MLDCNIKAASKKSDTNGCYSGCMEHYWPQPYAKHEQEHHDDMPVVEEQEQEDEEDMKETQPEMLDNDDEALEESDDHDNAIDRMAEPDQVFDQEVTQEDDPAASDQDNFNNLVLVAAAAQESNVAEAHHKDNDDHDSHQKPTSIQGGHPVATVTGKQKSGKGNCSFIKANVLHLAYTTSHVTVMPDGQPLPTNGHGVPGATSGASQVAALLSITLPMLMLSLLV